jgi:hypothetical protein
MADTSTNFFINSAYSPSFDITWSFQFKLSSGNTAATGGFSTFLFNDPKVVAGSKIVGGGKYTGLAYAPYGADAGVTGAALGVMITNDTKLVIKSGGTFSNLGSVTNILSSMSFNSNTLINRDFITIRFNLTNLGQNFNIAIKEPITDSYKTISSINTGLKINDLLFYKIGFGYSSPLASGDPKLILTLKDIHTQGSLTAPKTKVSVPPFIFPTPETFYILQSPSSGKIAIGIPDPIVDGYLMHK